MRKKSVRTESPAGDAQLLTISPEKVCFVIIKAKEYDAKDEVAEVDPGSNPSDDKDVSVCSRTTKMILSLMSLRRS